MPTPIEQLEEANTKITALEAQVKTLEAAQAAADAEKQKAMEEVQAMTAAKVEAEAKMQALQQEIAQKEADAKAAQDLAEEAEKRATVAEAKLKADPAFARVTGEQSPIPEGGGDGEMSEDAAWLKAYNAESNPAKRRKMYEEREAKRRN